MKVFTSDGVIQDGDYFYGVEIRDTPPGHTTVDMTGGSVEQPGMFMYDGTVLNFFGGGVYNLESRDSSTINFLGGSVDRNLLTYGNSCVNIYGGMVFPQLSMSNFNVRGSSTVNAYGGVVGAITNVGDSSTVNIYDGWWNHLSIAGKACANIYGGTVGYGWGLFVGARASVNIYGSGFDYDPEWLWHEDFGRWISRFTGVGPDGVPIDIREMPDPFTSPNINIIPEPGTFLLLGLGVLRLLGQRKING